jgi:hypothetical protein
MTCTRVHLSTYGKNVNSCLDDDTAINRASLWKGWCLQKAANSRQCDLNDLVPAIACQYDHVWKLELIDEDMILRRLLYQIGDHIQSLINSKKGEIIVLCHWRHHL